MISPIKKTMKIVSASAVTLVAFLSATLCKAQEGFFDTSNQAEVKTIKVVRGETLGANVTSLINYFLGFLGLVAVGFIIYGGVLMVTSAGEEEGVGKAKKIITYAAIGIVIIMLSYTIVTFVTSALNA